MKVLVTTYKTASDRIALAAIRGLSLAGHEPWLGTDDPLALAARSRHCRGVCLIPNPITDRHQHVVAVMKCVRFEGFDTILPSDDYAVFALSLAQEEDLLTVPVPVPPLAGQQRALDKADATALAASLGLHVPETLKVADKSELRHALKKIPPPWVIKLNKGGGSVGLLITDDVKAAEEHARSLPDYHDPVFDFNTLLVQSYVPGWTEDVYILMHEGKPVRSMATRRLLSFPDQHGGGCLAETIPQPTFFDDAVALLEALEWHGPANLEFRIDHRDGTPHFIEINGRLWGTTAAAIAAGVNFPALSCEMARGGGLAPQLSFPEGVVTRFPFPLGISLLAASRNKLSVGWQMFGPSLRRQSEFWWSDPAPGLVQLWQGLSALWSRHAVRVLSPLSMAREDQAHQIE